MKKQLSCLFLFSSLLFSETNTTQSDLEEVESNSKAIIEAKRLKEENRQLKEALMQSEIERLKVENAQLKNTQQPIQSTRLDASMPLKSQSNNYFGFGFGKGYDMQVFRGTNYLDYSIIDLKYGVISSKNNRVEFTYSYQTPSLNNYAGLDIDWMQTFSNRDQFLNGFLSIGLGLNSWLNAKEDLGLDKGPTGTSFNLGLGVLLQMGSSELEISYRMKAISWSAIDYFVCYGYTCLDYSVEVSDFIEYTYIGYKIYLD